MILFRSPFHCTFTRLTKTCCKYKKCISKFSYKNVLLLISGISINVFFFLSLLKCITFDTYTKINTEKNKETNECNVNITFRVAKIALVFVVKKSKNSSSVMYVCQRKSG